MYVLTNEVLDFVSNTSNKGEVTDLFMFTVCMAIHPPFWNGSKDQQRIYLPSQSSRSLICLSHTTNLPFNVAIEEDESINDWWIDPRCVSLNCIFGWLRGPAQKRFKYGHFQVVDRISVQMMRHAVLYAPLTIVEEWKIEVVHPEVIFLVKEIVSGYCGVVETQTGKYCEYGTVQSER